MNPGPTTTGLAQVQSVSVLLARFGLGFLFIYMGVQKALHPVEFLKLVRQYDILDHPFLLNFVASTLPWFEIFCGVLLILGIAVRGTAVLLIGMLVPFTVAVFLRAKGMSETGGLPFCSIQFDCGCGAGEVLICKKLAENLLLTAVAVLLVFWKKHWFALKPSLVKG